MIVTLIITGAIAAAANVLVGRSIMNKFEMGVVIGALTMPVAFSWYDAAFVAIAVILWRALGPGKYFMAIHGRDLRYEEEHPVADAFLYNLERKGPKLDNRLYGTIGMSIRWTFDALPIALWYHSAWPLLLLLSGPSYWLGGVIQRKIGKDVGVIIGEALSGFLLGIIVILSI